MTDDPQSGAQAVPLSFGDLLLAYRRAKVDLYYATHSRSFDLITYEESLESNLSRLLALINGSDRSWIRDPSFLGGYTIVPKTLDTEGKTNDGFIYSDDVRTWDRTAKSSSSKPRAEFRIMSVCSIDMHVLSSLWLMKVGQKYDSLLDRSALGGRLRRPIGLSKPDLRNGSFPSYLHAYREWRDGGMRAINRAIEDDESILVMTADASSFYHSVDVRFLAEESFNRGVMDIAELSKTEHDLHEIFIDAVSSWSTHKLHDS